MAAAFLPGVSERMCLLLLACLCKRGVLPRPRYARRVLLYGPATKREKDRRAGLAEGDNVVRLPQPDPRSQK
eukprot:2361896-Prorocentrum_lima.AAC.1